MCFITALPVGWQGPGPTRSRKREPETLLTPSQTWDLGSEMSSTHDSSCFVFFPVPGTKHLKFTCHHGLRASEATSKAFCNDAFSSVKPEAIKGTCHYAGNSAAPGPSGSAPTLPEPGGTMPSSLRPSEPTPAPLRCLLLGPADPCASWSGEVSACDTLECTP